MPNLFLFVGGPGVSFSSVEPRKAAALLLSWYDKSARLLPWRAPPRAKSRMSPYRVWLSEVMLQQTTVVSVSPYFTLFTDKWPEVRDLAEADLDSVLRAWAGLGYYARARNLHKCAQEVAFAREGRFPETEAALRELPGVGPYTAAAIAAIAFDRPAVVVDGNVERVMARLFAVETPLPDAKPELYAAAARLTPRARPGDYAQGVMDLGATVCAPRSPACGLCPWGGLCAARRLGIAAELPKKRPKAKKPTRLGVAYLALDPKGRVLLQRRPERGLLGGMLGLPGTEWSEAGPSPAEIAAAAPLEADWRDPALEARHVFTHFNLRLGLRIARVRARKAGPEERWAPRETLSDEALPTLMRKAARLGLDGLDALD